VAWDANAVGLALGLAALAACAANAAVPRSPAIVEAAARAVALVLLPGWAASRVLLRARRAGAFERGAALVGAGAAIALVAGGIARSAGVAAEAAGAALAALSLVVLAPRRPRRANGGPAFSRRAAVAAMVAGAAVGLLGLAAFSSAGRLGLSRTLAWLLAPAGDAESGARAFGALAALLLALSCAGIVRRWTRSVAAAALVALLVAAGAASVVFASRVRLPDRPVEVRRLP